MISPFIKGPHAGAAHILAYTQAVTKEDIDEARAKFAKAAEEGTPHMFSTVQEFEDSIADGTFCKPRLVIERHTDGTVVGSIDEAEDAVLKIVDEHVDQTGFTDTNEYALWIAIARQANNIAQNTKRALGNTVLAHPDLLGRFTPLGGAEYTIGRWTFQGTTASMGAYKVFTSDHLPENRIYVTYSGDTDVDGPAHLIDQEGVLKLAMLDSREVADYFSILEV